MEFIDWLKLIASIISGIAVCIPVVYKLVAMTKECQQQKNWEPLLSLIMRLMETAEQKFSDGATRKEYVLAMVQTSAEYVRCPIDITILSQMIDNLCDFSNVVNPPSSDKEVTEGTNG